MNRVVIGKKTMERPIIQGGMGVGVSLGNLAGHVAKEGGMGVISTANIGYKKEGFWKNPAKCNEEALREEIQKAKEISEGKGLLAVNIMVCTTNFNQMAEIAVDSGIDAIISGAGLPLSLPTFTKEHRVLAAPIVSSGRAAQMICKMWDRKFKCIPDFLVIEGPKAGGHLGFTSEELLKREAKDLFTLLEEVQSGIALFEEKYENSIPIFVAGGVRNGKELLEYREKGATGIQIATKFIGTEECDASLIYKQKYVEKNSEDLCIIESPVGLPGRAIHNPFVDTVSGHENVKIKGCVNCIHTCTPQSTPYCITKALIQAVSGDWENGLFFSGAEIDDVTEISTVKKVMTDFMKEMEG